MAGPNEGVPLVRRYRLIAALLQAASPLTFTEIVAECGLPGIELLPTLKELVHERLVVEGDLVPDKPGPQYCWRARWDSESQRQTLAQQKEVRTRTQPSGRASVPALSVPTPSTPSPTVQTRPRLDLESESAQALYRYVVEEYQPPKDKRFLVFLQCSVRRPFSSSPSHAWMRRAIEMATGYDPRHDFEICPVHVVVLASTIGPVPYELEDTHPANVPAGGVRHMRDEDYARTKPILAERLAQYMVTHGPCYDRIATFTKGRYGDVMDEAKRIARERLKADIPLAILPQPGGPRVRRMGQLTPRQYWTTEWIQLYLEIVRWLPPLQQAQAEARLKAALVEYK